MTSTLEAVTFTTPTPDGAFTVLAGPSGILAAGWAPDASSLLPLVHKTLRPAQLTELATAALGSSAGSAALAPETVSATATRTGSGQPEIDPRLVAALARDALVAYYDGDIDAPGSVAVHQASGPFREHAWNVLREVRPGEAITYTEYAERAGRPAAVRAAASACAMNAAALFVPCHRVLRSDGSLGGFRYGLPIKERLLAREVSAA